MICPYNGFKEMDCTKCAAYLKLYYFEVHNAPHLEVCSIAWHGGVVPNKPLFYLPEQKLESEWR